MIGRSFPPRRHIPQRQWRGALLLLLLLAARRPDDCLLKAHGTHPVSPGPAMPSRAVACPPTVGAMHAAGRFPLQPPHSMRHPLLGWKAQTPMSRGGPGMPLDPCEAHVLAQFPQALAKVRAERAKDGFLPLWRYDADVVSARPPDMAVVVPCSHGGFSFGWPWRLHPGSNHIPLHESTPERQSLFESHRQRRWLTHWS
jgi:hypothetical protein